MANSFPKDFLWGASTSAHQVEGNNTNNDWWKWEQSGGTDPSGIACDHYNRYKDDFRIAKELGHNAHRLGLEWSRLEPEEGKWDQKEWDHYKDVLDELISLGIEPVLTVHHFTLPQWLSNKGGWLNSDSSDLFSRFAGKAVQEIGHRANYWITINEPNVLATLGYYFGEWTPCAKSFEKMVLVIRNMIRGHAKAYIKMKGAAKNNPSIGLAKAVTAFHPCSKLSIRDRLSACIRNRFHNHGFISCCMKGSIRLPGTAFEKLPAKDTLDFIGINYYFRQFINNKQPFYKMLDFGEVCDTKHHPDAGDLTDMGWEIYPKGIYEIIKQLSKYKKPIMVTENGLATKDDAKRKDYIKSHLSNVLKAIDDGYNVAGYLHWSLLDNFEWAEGFSKRFGLVGVNYDTQERHIRDSARYYAEVIRTGKL